MPADPAKDPDSKHRTTRRADSEITRIEVNKSRSELSACFTTRDGRVSVCTVGLSVGVVGSYQKTECSYCRPVHAYPAAASNVPPMRPNATDTWSCPCCSAHQHPTSATRPRTAAPASSARLTLSDRCTAGPCPPQSWRHGPPWRPGSGRSPPSMPTAATRRCPATSQGTQRRPRQTPTATDAPTTEQHSTCSPRAPLASTCTSDPVLRGPRHPLGLGPPITENRVRNHGAKWLLVAEPTLDVGIRTWLVKGPENHSPRTLLTFG